MKSLVKLLVGCIVVVCAGILVVNGAPTLAQTSQGSQYKIGIVNLQEAMDAYEKQITAIDELKPDDARVYGYEDPDIAKSKPMIVKFMVDTVEAFYLMMPINETEKLLEIDETPLFDL